MQHQKRPQRGSSQRKSHATSRKRLLPPRFGTWLALTAWIPAAALALVAPQPIGQEAESAWLIACLGALVYGAHKVRRGAARQRALLDAMRRVAERDFSARVRDRGDDDLGRLATTFNQMTARLGLKFAALDTLSQIDQVILSKFDIEAIARLALVSARRIVGCEFALLGLFESGGNAMRTFALRASGGDDLYRNKLTLDAALRSRIPALASRRWSRLAPLPANFFAEPLEGGRTPVFNVSPIARGGRTWGMLVLGHGRPITLREEQFVLLSGITDRLAVAFSTGERDRRLHLLAHRDPLTGLPNRPALLELLAQEIARAKRAQRRVAVLFLDLDRFKQTNDTLGHAIGDALLREAAARIRRSVRGADAVARHGGDEFTIVLGDLSSNSSASQVARQLIRALSAPFEIEGHTAYVGASVGIAIYPDNGVDGPDLLKKADTAMYRAKDAGRSRLCYFDEQMNRDVQHRAALDRELRRALEAGEFVLHYQPQIDLATGTVCSVEALLRWQHPQRGLIMPAAFIPFAEENGLIDAIGNWVLREAFRQYRRWREIAAPIPRIAINVSTHQLRRSFVRNVKTLIDQTGMPRGGLEIEVTESVFVEGGRSALEAVTALEKAGVRIAIDDFGCGYSSFGYLRTLPAEVIKIDRSFILGVPQARDTSAIVDAMITVARALRKQVVAEGVDNPAQIDYLVRRGCDKVQGHLYSPAVPAADAAEFARRMAAQARVRAAEEAAAQVVGNAVADADAQADLGDDADIDATIDLKQGGLLAPPGLPPMTVPPMLPPAAAAHLRRSHEIVETI